MIIRQNVRGEFEDWYVDSNEKKKRPNITEEFAAHAKHLEGFNAHRIQTPPPKPIEALNTLSKSVKAVKSIIIK